ncbi:MAG: hypothetical protein J0L99_17100 [Chitinophagales bacterium]|nr:hypothetical protein [Chitinophagales bacterium]
MHAQNLSKAEALAFSEKLLENKIINDKGKYQLDSFIQTGNFVRSKLLIVAPHKEKYREGLSCFHILQWLGRAFYLDMMFRSGLVELEHEYEQALKSAVTWEERTKIRAEMQIAFSERRKFYEGPAIEAAIHDEDMLESTLVMTESKSPGINNCNVIHPSRSTTGKTVRRTIKDLYQIGLIDKKIYDKINEDIVPNKEINEFVVLLLAMDQTVFYEDFEENKIIEQFYINKFKQEGLLTKDGLVRLNNPAYSDKILTPYDIFRACKYTFAIKDPEFSDKPEQFFEKMYTLLKDFVPDFDFHKFTILVENKTPNEYSNGIKTYQISFEVKGEKYGTQISDPSLLEDTITIMSFPYFVELFEPVNQFLINSGQEVRLFHTKPLPESEFKDDGLLLLLLTAKQYKSGMSISLFGPEKFNSKTNINVKKAVALYKKIGLLDHLSESDWEKFEANLKYNTIKNYQDLLLCFPNVIVDFDWEMDTDEKPYKNILLYFARCSQGNFDPQNIVDEYRLSNEEETGRLAFDFGNKHYETTFKMPSAWLERGFLDLIERALSEQNIDGRFYYCLDGGQESGFVFLTRKQFKILQEKQPTLFLRD